VNPAPPNTQGGRVPSRESGRSFQTRLGATLMVVGVVALVLGVAVRPAQANTSQNNGCLGVTGTFSQFAIPITGHAQPNPVASGGTITLTGTSVSIGVDSTLIGAGVVAGLVSAADSLADIGAVANDGTPTANAGVDAVTTAAGKVTLKITGSNTSQGVQTASNPAAANLTFYVTADSAGGSVHVYTDISKPPSSTPDPTRTGTLLAGALNVPIPLGDTTWTPTGGNVVFAEQNVAPASLTAPSSTDQLAAPLILLPKINGAISTPFHCWPGTVSTATTPNPLVPAASSAIDTVTVNAATTSTTAATTTSTTSGSTTTSTTSAPTTTSTTSAPTTTSTTAPPAPSVTVSPDTGLVDGQVVNVSASGFAPGDLGTVIECNNDASQPTVDIFGNAVPVGCSSLFPLVNFDASGNLPAMPLTIHEGTVGPPQPGTDSLGNDAAVDAANFPCPATAAQKATGVGCDIVVAGLSGQRVTVPVTYKSEEVTTTTTAPTTTTTAKPGPPSASTNLGQVAPGGTLTFSVDNFDPFTDVNVTLHSTPVDLGSTKTDGNGHFSVAITIPTGIDPGQHTLVASAANGQSASVSITVVAAATTTTAGRATATPASVLGTSTTSTPLAFTGLDARAWLMIAAGCLLTGFIMLFGNPRQAARPTRR